MYRYFLKDFGREGEKVIIERSVYIEGCLPLHGHDFLEIFYIEKGAGFHILNNTKTHVSEGDLIFLSYNSVHTLVPETEDFTWINLSFYPEFIDKSLINEFNSNEIIRLSVFKSMFEDNTVTTTSIMLKGVKEEFAQIFSQMEDEYRNKKYGYVQILKYDLLIVLTKIFRDMEDVNKKPGELSNSKLINSVLEEAGKQSRKRFQSGYICQKGIYEPQIFFPLFQTVCRGHIHGIRSQTAHQPRVRAAGKYRYVDRGYHAERGVFGCQILLPHFQTLQGRNARAPTGKI